jgi:glycosyltransferase involved in cell wall biosynthesis
LQNQAASRKKRVVFVINSLAGGGAERVMCTLLEASQGESGEHDITLILLDREPSAYRPPDWIKIEQLDCRHSLVRSTWQLYLVLRRLRPATTLSFLTRANLANVIACKLLGIPAVISERVNTSTHLGTGRTAAIAKLCVRMLYPMARRIIAVSPGVAEDLAVAFGISRAKIVAIANPIDVERIRSESARDDAIVGEEGYLMAMGRLVPNKNFAMLIEALATARTDERLIIFGEGPERERLQFLIEQYGLGKRITLAGFAANPFAALKRAAMFILPSNAEGFPNSLLEAMSLGVPVVSTNCTSGPSEVLADLPREAIGAGVTFAQYGVLVPPNDSASMAEAITAMADPQRRRDFGAKAAARAEYYSVGRAKDLYWQELRANI